MSGISPHQAAQKVAQYKTAVMDEIQRRCSKYIDELTDLAIEYRRTNLVAHDFTGNLLNSIAVALYRSGKLVEANFASDRVEPAIKRKMTVRNGHYYFSNDYSGVESEYDPTIDTDEGFGRDDAHRFVASYRPPGRHLFDIVVVYATEYATWVERMRASTGILALWADAPYIAVTCLELGKSN